MTRAPGQELAMIKVTRRTLAQMIGMLDDCILHTPTGDARNLMSEAEILLRRCDILLGTTAAKLEPITEGSNDNN